jgi:protein-tyrosine phosphatase
MMWRPPQPNLVKEAGCHVEKTGRVKAKIVPGSVRSATKVAAMLLAAVVGLVVVGNVAIMAASWWANRTTSTSTIGSVRGVDNLQAVDDRLWRGAAPTADGYRGLAQGGITTVVDLRAESGVTADAEAVRQLGMRYVHLPVRDGQVPDAEQVSAFLRLVDEAPGRVFVHCGAGVGRTGAMVGAYLVGKGGDVVQALKRNLAVGPPTLEQVVFVAKLDRRDGFTPVGAGVTAMSRVIDFPRRAWHVIGL